MPEVHSYKVLLFGVYPLDSGLIKGGVAASVYGLAGQLAKTTDTAVKVISYPQRSVKKDYAIEHARITKVYLSNPYRSHLLAFLRIKKIIKEIKNYHPDIVHIHGTHLIDLLLILYLRLKRYNYVLTVHGILTVEHWKDHKRHPSAVKLIKYWVYSVFEYLSIKFADQIIVDTIYVKEWILRHVMSRADAIHVIPQGIDSKFYSVPDLSHNRQLLSIGSITERKGYEYAIKAVHLLLPKYPDIKYYIIGFCQDDRYYTRLYDLIGEMGMRDNVFILTDTDELLIRQYLSNAAIFILHSQEESQGIVFCEAMAAGKPIVATSAGGIPYIIKQFVNGFLTEFGETEKFSMCIDELLQDESKRRSIGKTNRMEAALYNWETITNNIMSVYRIAN
ncbi:glycosyltransferase family 4 protein [Mucilaginibacter mali]|uniref:Glycosyltransferase family 4 protein n=1 Tax=Mucilaginibacter mali TaxID=2740462 RepID=A0A7D4QDA3_9SPHI|nr:glycosyltransferase family 4 protein [Mucilaginibacter mali]QKJ31484.1 glycosyltransferase family 4 protein [Mucilaginibacter mali]